MSTKERVYLISYNSDYYRNGKIANIIGIKKVTTFTNSYVPIANTPMLCYQIVFEDGEEDFIDFAKIQSQDWHFVTIEELIRVGQPR